MPQPQDISLLPLGSRNYYRPHSEHPKLSGKYSSVPPVPNPSKIKCPSLTDPDPNWCPVSDNHQGSIHFFSMESTLWSQRSDLSNPHFDKNESGFTNWQTSSALLRASIQCPLNVTIGWSTKHLNNMVKIFMGCLSMLPGLLKTWLLDFQKAYNSNFLRVMRVEKVLTWSPWYSAFYE